MSKQIRLFPKLSLLYFLCLWSISVRAERVCYWPDGTSTNGSVIACEADGVSHCCAEGEACLSNGLCFSAIVGLMYRGACTDKSWAEDTTECPLFCAVLPAQANMHMCQNKLWCGNGTQCEQGDGSDGTISELYEWTKGVILHIAKTSTATSSAAAATSSSCIAGVCISTIKCLPISVPIGVGAGIGFPLAFCATVLGIMLKREKRKRSVVLSHHDSMESELRLNTPAYDQDSHRTTGYKQWNRDEYSPETQMLGGQQVHELGTHLYELPPTGRAK